MLQEASPRNIYLYEDDLALANEIIAAFAREEHRIELIPSETALRQVVLAGQADALVMDRMIGENDSLTLIEQLRAEGDRVPVVFISSLASVDERIRALKSGGDDYLVKPFAMSELIARVDAVCRRVKEPPRTVLSVGPLTIDLLKRNARRGEREIDLLPREFSLLEYLMRHANQLVTRSMLLENVWNYHSSAQTNVVDVHLGHLRRKVDAEGEEKLIQSVRGAGFKLTA